MIKAYLILRRHWEYDDSFYNFVGHEGVAAVCFSREQADARARDVTAEWVRNHRHELERYEDASTFPWPERDDMLARAETYDDDALFAFAREVGVVPVTIQEVLLTPEFLHTAALSSGKRTALLRKLGATIRPLSASAADHLESHEE